MRWWLAVAMLLTTACGQSFVEADAIYKDEVDILDALENEYEKEQAGLVFEHRGKATKRIDDGERRYATIVQEWKEKQAKTIKAWEDEHAYEWVPTEFAERRAEFEKSLGGAPQPPPLQTPDVAEEAALKVNQKKVDEHYGPLIELQKNKVREAKRRREAAK